jgi:hypothetical protein
MDTVVIETKNKAEVKFWLNLAKKTGTNAFVAKQPPLLMQEIEKGLTEVKEIQSGKLSKKSIKDMLDGK